MSPVSVVSLLASVVVNPVSVVVSPVSVVSLLASVVVNLVSVIVSSSVPMANES